MAFTLISGARHSCTPLSPGRTSDDAAGFASRYGPLSCSPFTGLLIPGFDPTRLPAEPPACYRPPGSYPDRTSTG